MKKMLTITIAAMMTTAAIAGGDDIKHYDAQSIKDSASAIQILKNAEGALFKTLSLPEISSNDYEELHQTSYTMEAAIEKIENDNAYSKEVVKPLSNVIHDIHEASEDYKKSDLEKASQEYSELLKAL